MRTLEYATTTSTTTTTASTHVPAFLTKLWKLVTDGACDDLISWSLAGTSFIIYDEIRFSKELLPLYFKHNNMASFVRQLNMYGFRKLSCIDQGGMHCYKNEIEFYHQYFLKGQETLLELIKRKIPTSKCEDQKGVRQVDELTTSVRALRGRQEGSEHGMRHLRKENRLLWRHVNMLTDRYSKQQAVLQQLLPFFVNMMRGREAEHQLPPLKRKAPLMIDEGGAKVARLAPPDYYSDPESSNQGGMNTPPGNLPRGPVIHDVTEQLEYNQTTNNKSEGCSSLEKPPFVEPASVDAFNSPLNPNSQRARSYSLGSPLELRRRPPLSAPLRLVSPDSTTGYAPPPSIVIDEASSDVPMVASNERRRSFGMSIEETSQDVPITMMRSPLISEMEDSCSQGAMFNVGQMMSAPTLMSEDAILTPPLSFSRSKSPLLQNSMMGGPAMMGDDDRSMNSLQSPPMKSPLLTVTGPMMMSEDAILTGGSPPMMSCGSPPMTSPLLTSTNPMMGGGSPVMSSPPMKSPLLTVTGPLMGEDSILSRGSSPMTPMMMGDETILNRSPNLLTVPMMGAAMRGRKSPLLSVDASPRIGGCTSPLLGVDMNNGAGCKSPMMDRSPSPLLQRRRSPMLSPLDIPQMSKSPAMSDCEAPVDAIMRRSPNMINAQEMAQREMLLSHQSLINSASSAFLTAPPSLMGGNLLTEDISPPAGGVRRQVLVTQQAMLNQRANMGAMPQSVKNGASAAAEMNWLMNQEMNASEPSIENWLGQIFKADNLTAGCSLPPPQKRDGVESLE